MSVFSYVWEVAAARLLHYCLCLVAWACYYMARKSTSLLLPVKMSWLAARMQSLAQIITWLARSSISIDHSA